MKITEAMLDECFALSQHPKMVFGASHCVGDRCPKNGPILKARIQKELLNIHAYHRQTPHRDYGSGERSDNSMPSIAYRA